MRPCTEPWASSAEPIALAYRRSIFSRTSSRLGVVPGAAISLIDRSDALTCSCIFACSSWLSSLVRSATFCCSTIEFCSTAFLAWAAAFSAWSCRVLRSSTLCSAVTSWAANASAALLYSVALAVSPAAVAWSASVSA